MADRRRKGPPFGWRAAGRATLAALMIFWAGGPRLLAATITLKNGMTVRGQPGKIASLAEDPRHPKRSTAPVDTSLITFVDDGLRRTFFSVYQVQNIGTAPDPPMERIEMAKRVARGPRRIATVGPLIRATPFDQWGNRIVSLQGPRGRIDLVQGITEITPVYVKVEGLLTQPEWSYAWDMRLATSSLPRKTLSQIMRNAVDPTSPDERLKIVRLYMQAERFREAEQELEAALEDFPELSELQTLVSRLRQLNAARLVDEIEQRREAGQHQLVLDLLRRFPEEGVAAETLLRVRELLEQYGRREEQRKRAAALLAEHLEGVAREELRRQAAPLVEEITARLNLATLDRMGDYLRLADDASLRPEQKLALAISGWLLGQGAGLQNLGVALSLAEARDLAAEYLASEDPSRRQAILERLQSVEGATPPNLARLLARMRPPAAPAASPAEAGAPAGLHQLTAPALTGQPDVAYWIQLPPEYNPDRRYPCVVALAGEGGSPQGEIDWWAGPYDPKTGLRLGQGARRGYIVLAPEWRQPGQRAYWFSAREHAAVLFSLRDACRRFSIDTDRVFLAGHFMGGDAAWDIGLAHPDLWAGVIPISALADKYIERYWEHARYVPMYFVCGDMDGDNLFRNGVQWDRYFTRSGFDVMVAAYKGRGREHFYDEILRLYDWMDLHRRDFFPREFSCVTLRPWDNFFWWVETAGLPASSIVLPLEWPRPQAREATIEARALATNGVNVSAAGQRTTVWLAPELVDFDRQLTVVINRSRERSAVQPSIAVMLEDARTRCDRQHPFWAKVER